MSRLTRLEVEGYMKIVGVDVPLAGVTEISGKNGAGKTSFLSAIEVLVDGLKAAPAEPINSHSTRTRIRGRFGELNVIRFIEHKKGGGYTTRIQFETPEGKPYPATQTQLTELIGEHRLDPLDFLNLDSKSRFAALQAFVPGVDFAASARDDSADYTRRTEVGRIAKESRAAAGLIIVPADTPAEPIDESDLVDQLAKAGGHNTEIEKRLGVRASAAQEVARKRAAAEAAMAAIPQAIAKVHAQNDQLATALRSRIEELESQLADLRTQLADHGVLRTRTAEAEETRLRGEAAEHAAKADELQARIDTAEELPAPIDIVALQARINAARTTNAAVARAAERNRHNANADRYEAEATTLTEAMDARRAAREAAIAAAKMPVQGLEFGDGEIRLHGVPFEQASTAHKVKAAFEYCVGCNPKLRLIWIRDASLLDDDIFAQVGRLAVEFDCTVLLETVRPIGSNSVVLEDGRVKAIHHQAEQESAA